MNVPTFVKWAGGKKQLLQQFKDVFPKEITTYHEPFVGGGSVAFYIIKNHKPKKVFISDINEELINCYKVIKNDVKELIWSLKQYAKMHSKKTYYNFREQNPQKLSSVQRAARFIYLNKTCFNGLYRVNSTGKFNVPIGSYNKPAIVQEEDLKEISRLLKKAVINKTSFEAVLNVAKKGDFIYFDPPYYPIKKGQSFTTYTKENFLEKEQETLARTFKSLDKRGCLVMLSNSDTEFIKKRYKDYNITIVKAKRMINCDATKRGAINELVVTNYPIDKIQKTLKTV
ncbi:D12 class N6 adenine-specific DNA methyltransferase [uncultured archaeon]|nr:D12 class N6 adenine-specific DNA methyltransferase [uncultured archaeon]